MKTLVLDFFDTLNRHDIRTSASQVIHVWIDSAPSDSPPLLDMYEDVSKSGKGRGRKGRGRSNSLSEEKKKIHPRSKEVETLPLETPDVPRLCRTHFFTGNCSGKKGGCRHVHLPGRYKTLFQVVNADSKSPADTLDTLSLSEMAIPKEDENENANGVDMLYYISIPVDRTDSSDGESPLHMNELVSKKLAQESCGVGSIVYLAIDNHLIFDRYRGGTIISKTDLQFLLYGNERRLRSASVFSDEGGDDENNQDDHDGIALPAHVLEYILMFLPDEAVSSMSLVSVAWNHEIGQHSPDLWRSLLARRQWPMPADDETDGTGATLRDTFRSCFLRHYTVVRDMDAIELAAGAISSPSRKAVVETDMVYEVFSARRLAPQEPNYCVAVRVWSADQVLAAYSQDCTLRLFKAVAKSADGGSPRACRELVCVSVDPYRNTRRQRSHLVAMDIDGDVIGCLCNIMENAEDKEAYILAVTRRDDFLCAAGDNHLGGASLEDGRLHVINVGEAVLNYLVSCEEVDHRLLRLFDFLSDGGDISEVEVLVSHSIQACGYGRFLLEVAISIPSFELEDIDDESAMILLDRKLILFSAGAGAIVWMGDSNPTDELLPRHNNVSMASFSQIQPGERRATCCLAFVSSASHMILSTELVASGKMQSPLLVEASALVRSQLLQDNWQLQNAHHRPLVITSTDIVTVDSLFHELEGGKRVSKSVLSFYPRFAHGISYETLTIKGDCDAIQMERTHDDYVVVLCHVDRSDPNAGDNDVDAVDGEWFGGQAATEESSSLRTLDAVVIHVPSRKQIHRVRLLGQEPSSDVFGAPIVFTPCGSGSSTVAVGLGGKGFVMTGMDVRDVGCRPLHMVPENAHRPVRKQKKKKRNQGKGGKKDAFARGMSLRG